MKTLKRTPEVVNFIKENYTTIQNSELEKNTGLPFKYITKIANSLGIKRRVPFTEEQIKEINNLLEQGNKLTRIAKKINVDYFKLQNFVRKFSCFKKEPKKEVKFYLDKPYSQMNAREKKAYERWAKKTT